MTVAKWVGAGIGVFALALLVTISAEWTLSIGPFTPSSVTAIKPVNGVVFTAFGNGTKDTLPLGAPVGNFVVTKAAYITNASNSSYADGSAVGGIAQMTLNGTVVNGNVYTADILVGVNGSTNFDLPVMEVDNGSLSTTQFQIQSVELVGLGTNVGVTHTVSVTLQPTQSTPAYYDFGAIAKGLWMLEIGISPTSSHASGGVAVTYGLYSLGGATVGLTSAAFTSGSTITNFQLNWKN